MNTSFDNIPKTRRIVQYMTSGRMYEVAIITRINPPTKTLGDNVRLAVFDDDRAAWFVADAVQHVSANSKNFWRYPPNDNA